MVTQAMLDGVTAPLDNMLAQLGQQAAQAAQGQTPSLVTANDYADQILQARASWPPLPVEAPPPVISELVRQLEDTAGTLIDGLRRRTDELTQRLDALSQASEDKHRETQALFEQFLQKINELGNTITTQASRLDTAISNYESTFSQGQEDRRQAFAAFLEEQRKLANSTITEIANKGEVLSGELRTTSHEVLVELKRLLQQAQDLVGAIGRTGFTAGYQQYGESERKAANFWRWIAIGLLMLGVVSLAIIVAAALEIARILPGPVMLDGYRVALLIAFLSALFGVGSYAARQSARHRSNAEKARNMELALASMEPFLQPLDEERKNTLLEAFAFVFFGQQSLPGEAAEGVELPQSQIFRDILQRLSRRRTPPGS
jgi:hypothetical protein